MINDVTDKLNMLEFTMRYMSKDDAPKTNKVVFMADEWHSAIRNLRGNNIGILNLYNCNIGRFWEDYNNDDLWERRDILNEIVSGFRAVRNYEINAENLYSMEIMEEKERSGLVPFQKLLLKYCDREMLTNMISYEYLIPDEFEAAGRYLGAEANLEAYTQLFAEMHGEVSGDGSN